MALSKWSPSTTGDTLPAPVTRRKSSFSTVKKLPPVCTPILRHPLRVGEIEQSTANPTDPTVDTPDRSQYQGWLREHFAPAIDAIGPMVPKGITVAVCVPETIPVQLTCPRNDIREYCANYSDDRNVKFQMAVLTAPLDQYLAAPGSPNECKPSFTLPFTPVLPSRS